MRKVDFTYLSQEDILGLNIPMRKVIELVEKGLNEHGHKRVENPPKPGIHSKPDAFIHAMPAYYEALDIGGLKWVSGYPSNRAFNLPQIAGLMIVNDMGRESVAEGEQARGTGLGSFTDVNGDGRVSALDALQVINYLGRPNRSITEAELVPLPPVETAEPSERSTGSAEDAVFADLGGANDVKITSPALPADPLSGGTASMTPVGDSAADSDEEEDVLDLLVDDQLLL